MSLVEDILFIINSQDKENIIACVIKLVDSRMSELDKTSIQALFSLFNDKADQDLLWELMHLLEIIDDHIYIHCFVNNIELLKSNNAKEWIETISCRILNCPNLDVILRNELKKSTVALNIFIDTIKPISLENRKVSQTLNAFLLSL